MPYVLGGSPVAALARGLFGGAGVPAAPPAYDFASDAVGTLPSILTSYGAGTWEVEERETVDNGVLRGGKVLRRLNAEDSWSAAVHDGVFSDFFEAQAGFSCNRAGFFPMTVGVFAEDSITGAIVGVRNGQTGNFGITSNTFSYGDLDYSFGSDTHAYNIKIRLEGGIMYAKAWGHTDYANEEEPTGWQGSRSIGTSAPRKFGLAGHRGNTLAFVDYFWINDLSA